MSPWPPPPNSNPSLIATCPFSAPSSLVIQEVVELPSKTSCSSKSYLRRNWPLVQIMPPIKDIPRPPPIPMIIGPRGL